MNLKEERSEDPIPRVDTDTVCHYHVRRFRIHCSASFIGILYGLYRKTWDAIGRKGAKPQERLLKVVKDTQARESSGGDFSNLYHLGSVGLYARMSRVQPQITVLLHKTSKDDHGT